MRGPRAFTGLPLVMTVVLLLGAAPAAAIPSRLVAPRNTQAATSTGTPRPDDSSRPDRVSAQLLARQTGQRVEVTDLRTETSTTYANPSGTFTAEVTDTPTRIQTCLRMLGCPSGGILDHKSMGRTHASRKSRLTTY